MAIGCRDAEAEHDGQLGGYLPCCLNGDAGILHIEDGFDKQGVNASICQCLNLLFISLTESGSKLFPIPFFLFTHKGTAGGANASCHKTGFVRRAELVGTLTGQAGCDEVDLSAVVLHTIVAHRDALGIEGIRLDDVGACFKVFAMDIANDEGSGKGENVIAALQLLRMVSKTGSTEVFFAQLELLDHGTHSTVENENSVLV